MNEEDLLDFEPEMFIRFAIDMRFVRLIETRLHPTNIKLQAEMIAMDGATDDEIDLALAKIKYWTEKYVNNSVVFSAHNPSAINIILDQNNTPQVSNLLFMTPDEPTDDLLAEILACKINALAGGNLMFDAIEITSDNSGGLSFTYVGDGSNLPSANEWLSEPNWFDRPWWHRDDSSMIDTRPGEDDDITKKPEWAVDLNFLGQPTPQPTTVVMGSFKPEIIDGGKKD